MFLALMIAASLVQSAGTLAFDPPAAWKPRPAASSMRVAEFVAAKAPGDPEDAEVIVYYFGGGGGSVEANVQRWIAQFEQKSGRSAADAGRTTFNVGRLRITTVDVSGTYVAEVSPGAAERHHKPDFRMRAAVVETPRGPYFVKFTGPRATVTQHSTSFDQFLKSLRFQ